MGKLTKKAIDALQHTPESEFFVWDDSLPGFGVRVLPSGYKSWQLQYKRSGRTRRMSLGACNVLTPEQARKKASELLGELAQGGDPAKKRAQLHQAPNMRTLSGMYLERHAPKKKESSLRNDRSMLQNIILPALGSLKVTEVDRADIARLHHSLRSTPYQANRCLALLSKLFNLAEKWGLRPDNTNPTRHVEKYREQPRRRYLSGDELARLGRALAEAEVDNKESPFVVAAIRLLLFTGARVNEILTLRWDSVDLEGACLHLHDSKTGQKDVMLNAPALEVLANLPRIDLNPFVIVGKQPGSHWVNLSKPWQRIRSRAGLGDVRIHDLRHSFASVAVSSGMGLPIVGALLGHRESSTTQRYAHLAADPLKLASEEISQKIADAMKAKSTKKVVPFPRKLEG